MVHSNYLATKEAKIYRFKESMMWMVDDNGYYSSTDRKYLVYDNPYVTSRAGDGLKLEHDALLNALSIGYLLNRTVILPAFHCHETRHQICKRDHQECSLMAQYHLMTFDQLFSDAYREHVFLSHDLVPDSTRQSRTKPHVINTKASVNIAPVSDDVTDRVILTPANQSVGATPAEIRKWFGDLTEKVLVFDHLYAAFAGFGFFDEFREIDDRLRCALRACDYRQTCVH